MRVTMVNRESGGPLVQVHGNADEMLKFAERHGRFITFGPTRHPTGEWVIEFPWSRSWRKS